MMTREQLSLAKQINYLTDNRFVTGNIIEYDIKQANINMLYKYNVIDESKYIYLSNLPKINREIIVGNMIRSNKDVFNTIKKGIKEAKISLFDSNNINEIEVVRIADDAVYVNRVNGLKITKFDNIEFVPKSIYTTYLKLNSLLFFINFGTQINVDIKGLGDDYSIHEPIITVIVNIINQLQYDGVKSAMKTLNNFIEDYLTRKLDVSYYRELSPEGLYRVIGGEFFISNLPELAEEIDIGYNLYILRELSSILYEIYISNYRKL
jgi:hypothetical protein